MDRLITLLATLALVMLVVPTGSVSTAAAVIDEPLPPPPPPPPPPEI